jgi:hypothetical protein
VSLGSHSPGVVAAVLTGARASGRIAAICPGSLKNPTPLKAARRPLLIKLVLNIFVCVLRELHPTTDRFLLTLATRRESAD